MNNWMRALPPLPEQQPQRMPRLQSTASRNPRTSEGLYIPTPAEALHSLFMAINAYYNRHRELKMSREMTATLQAMYRNSKRFGIDHWAALSYSIDQVKHDACAQSGSIDDALITAQLALLARH